MEKKVLDKREEVISLLKKQKIREVKDLDAYKLSICHPRLARIESECYFTNHLRGGYRYE